MLHFTGKETEAQRLSDLFESPPGGLSIVDIGLEPLDQGSFLSD